MALVKCLECGKGISSAAEACPYCGRKWPKRTSVLTWIVVSLLGLGIFSAVLNRSSQTGASIASTSGPAQWVPDPHQTAIGNLDLKNLTWQKTGFGSVMEISVTLVNKGKQDVKDIKLTCVHFSNSDTRIDSNAKTIYEIVRAGKSKRINNFNMGFIHSQAASSSCSVTDLALM